MAINISPYAFTGVEIINNSPRPIPGIGILPFVFLIFFFSTASVYVLIKKLKNLSGIEKQQVRLVTLGILLLIGLLVTTILFPVLVLKVNFFVPFVPIYTLIFLGMTAYAIVQRHLFNIGVITTEAVTVILWIVLFAKVLVSETMSQRVVDALIFAIAAIFGILLIKSVRREVEQRERMEKLTADLERVNERLKEFDHAKSEFLNFASHQVKSPMATVKGLATLIEDGTYGAVSEQAKEGAHKIRGVADRLISLVNNLLDLGKIESGKLDFTMQEMDIVKLLATIVDEYQVLAGNKKLALSFESDKPSLMVKGDAEKLRQVVQNLVDNSIKYTDSPSTPSTGSGQAGWVKVACRDEFEKNSILISVMDSGRGLSTELLQKLFGRFVRDEKTKTEVIGTGLGLYIAKQIVLAHHGEIWAESEGVGKGSKFFVRLAKG